MIRFTDGKLWSFFQSNLNVVARRVATVNEKIFKLDSNEVLVTAKRPKGDAPWTQSGMHSFTLAYGDQQTGWIAAADGWVEDAELIRWECLKNYNKLNLNDEF
jgi:hypothetical protein